MFKVASKLLQFSISRKLFQIWGTKCQIYYSWKLMAGILKESYGMAVTLKGQVVVYSILGCPHCMRTKKLLRDEGIPFSDIRLDLYPHIRDDVFAKSGMQTVPQVFFNSTLIGGNDALQKLFENKSAWEERLQDVINNPVSEDGPIIPDPSTAVSEPDLFDVRCEPDEYFVLVSEMKEDNVICSHGLLFTQKHSFTGTEFLKWVRDKKGFDDEKGKSMGQALIDNKFVTSQKQPDIFKGGAELYILADEEEGEGALNAGPLSECVPKSANELGELLRKMILKLYSVFLSEDGKAVDYQGMKRSDEFKTYVRMTKELVRIDIKSASREEKLAFFINIYNALVIHATIERGPPKNLWGRYKFFNGTKYIIGGNVYSLQDIENGVLRANRKGVGQFSLPFGKKDPRLEVALDRHEPLIHFALVCGAKSCPPIKTYTTDEVYDQLKLAATAFVENDDGVELDVNNKTVKLSSIFKWYKVDFGNNDKELLQFIAHHMKDGMKKTDLMELIDKGGYKVSYLKYDWSINSKS